MYLSHIYLFIWKSYYLRAIFNLFFYTFVWILNNLTLFSFQFYIQWSIYCQFWFSLHRSYHGLFFGCICISWFYWFYGTIWDLNLWRALSILSKFIWTFWRNRNPRFFTFGWFNWYIWPIVFHTLAFIIFVWASIYHLNPWLSFL